MIEVVHLNKTYGNVQVLQDVSFKVEENQVFGLLGPNGSGKTTTLECMEGLRTCQEGTVFIDGKPPRTAMKSGWIGVQLQSSSLPDNITAREAMELFCTWNGHKNRLDLLEKFGLKEHMTKRYKTMSTGQKRRLHLALALSSDPRILFLDEPTAGLDVEARVLLHDEIRSLKKRGLTMILASHDMAEVESLCDRVAILVRGKIRTEGSPEDISSELEAHHRIKVKLDKEIPTDSLKELREASRINGYYYFQTEDLTAAMEELLFTLRQNQGKLLDLSVEKPSLEERFIQIARGDGSHETIY